MKRRLSILLALVFLFTAVIGASGVAVYAAEDENRIAGDTRYETAAKIAAAKYTSADTVIIVRGDDENNTPQVVDGLTASVLAGAKNAPILLTKKNELPKAAADAIKALGAKNAYIIGGTVAVSEDVEKALEDRGVAVKRIEGADRFATAVEVAKEANTGAKTAIVTQGFALVDSLVAGPLAYVKGYPILLVRENEVVEATEKAIKDLGIENIIIVGGEAVVSKDVEKALDELVTGSVKRLGGGDRVETSLLLADELKADEVALVNGWSFVDAVPASVLGLPILYVQKDAISNDILAYIGKKAGVKVIGGTSAISNEVATKAKEAVKFIVTEVSADNLKEIVVSFSQALDKDTVVADNFKLDGNQLDAADKVVLNEDGKSVTIILNTAFANNQTSFKLTISDVKSVSGKTIEETTVEGLAFDVTIPRALKAEQVGPSTIKVTFSEPVRLPEVSNFKINNGQYFIDGTSIRVDRNVVTFDLYTTLTEGTYTVTVSGVKDYANYSVITTNLTFTAFKDEVKPVVTKVVKATPEQVILEFSENIQLVTPFNDSTKDVEEHKYYHTNDKNTVDNVTVENGNQLKLDFTTNRLPKGVAYLYIAKDVVQDGWGNKNEEISGLPIQVSVDTVKPEVKEIKAISDKTIVIVFTEDVEETSATDVENYTVFDANGDKVTTLSSVSKHEGKSDAVALTFNSSLPGSVYTVVIENVKDLAGNVINKVSVPVKVVDTTAPELVDVDEDTTDTNAYLYAAKRVVKIVFNEPIKAEDLLNLGNYYYVATGKYLSQYKVTASVADGGKAVLLDFSKEPTTGIPANGARIIISKVHDLAGNPTENIYNEVILAEQDSKGIGIDKVEATGTKTIKVTLADTLANFEADDFIIEDAKSNPLTPAAVTFTNVDGKGVITFTLRDSDELTTTAQTTAGDAVFVKVVSDSGEIKSKNPYDIKVKAGVVKQVDDKIGPKIVSATFTGNNIIEITFTEEIKADTLSRFTFTVSGNTVTELKIMSNDKVQLILKDEVKKAGTKVKVTQELPIEDSRGNVSTGLTVEVTK